MNIIEVVVWFIDRLAARKPQYNFFFSLSLLINNWSYRLAHRARVHYTLQLSYKQIRKTPNYDHFRLGAQNIATQHLRQERPMYKSPLLTNLGL